MYGFNISATANSVFLLIDLAQAND